MKPDENTTCDIGTSRGCSSIAAHIASASIVMPSRDGTSTHCAPRRCSACQTYDTVGNCSASYTTLLRSGVYSKHDATTLMMVETFWFMITVPAGAEMILAMRSAARSTSGSQSPQAVIDFVRHSSKNSARSVAALAGTHPSECEMKCT